ncbi:hypothetical protein [Streptomyces chartreusis]|uniref:hypothetical protein n=1 Tax=Streptomyces chartreusis TaxID=1969 RepID=UPI0037BA5537
MWTPFSEARVQRRVGLGVVAAALVALPVVLGIGGGDADEASMWISAISAFVSLCAFVADLLRGPADDRSSADRRQRAADELAEVVETQWAAEARLRRLQDPEPLNVRWSRVGPPLADHGHNVRRGLPLPAPRDGDQRLDRIVQTFRALPAGRLVVLGDPGAGKTILAVQFVLGTLAARRPGDPVPVLFPLASWDPRAAGLREWLAERLAAEYRPLAAVGGDRTLARELLDAGLVLPVLDGFDEIAEPLRGEALRCLNAELDDRLPTLLTCRYADWYRAVRDGDVLTAAEVVRLRPLDLATARTYLDRTARSDSDGSTVWTPALDAPSAPLTEVLASPLMVALARTVYGDTSRDPAELVDTGRFPTAGHIEEHLLDAFVPAAFAGAGGTWRPEAAHQWLRRLARELASGRPGATRTWRLAWWELPAAMPRALGVLGPAVLAVVATASLLVPLAVWGNGVVGTWDSSLSAMLNLAGDLVGLCFGLALLLPDTAETPQGPRHLARMALKLTAAVTVLAMVVGLLAPPLIGFRIGTVIDSGLAWFFNGCAFGLVLSMVFAAAGLPRRPLPLGLPWAGTPSGPGTARVLGTAVALTGLAAYGLVGEVLPAVTCFVAGLLLYLAGLRRGERVPTQHASPAAVLSGFRKGLLRGFVTCTLIGVSASAVVGGITGAFAAYEIHSAPLPTEGEVIGQWRVEELDEGVRSVRSTGSFEGELLTRDGSAIPLAVKKGAWITRDWPDGQPFNQQVRIQKASEGWVVVLDGLPRADAHNLVLALPYRARLWLAYRPVADVIRDTMALPVSVGVLIGVIGGCASGVYRALNIPSDMMRAASPQNTLRTDRSATLVRGAIAAVLTGGVCLLLISVLGSGGPLGTLHTELWVPVGTSALALSAWGRMGPARVWLALSGRTPWRVMGFLEEAHRRGVLRQSGAHYEFRHLRLQQRLAATSDADNTGARPEPSPSS